MNPTLTRVEREATEIAGRLMVPDRTRPFRAINVQNQPDGPYEAVPMPLAGLLVGVALSLSLAVGLVLVAWYVGGAALDAWANQRWGR